MPVSVALSHIAKYVHNRKSDLLIILRIEHQKLICAIDN